VALEREDGGESEGGGAVEEGQALVGILAQHLAHQHQEEGT